MNTTETTYDIINGPSKAAVIDAFNYAYDNKSHIDLGFCVAIGYSMPHGDPRGCAFLMPIEKIRISKLAYEDGSGTKLILEGHCSASLSIGVDKDIRLYRFTAFYDTQRRKGWMRLSE